VGEKKAALQGWIALNSMRPNMCSVRMPNINTKVLEQIDVPLIESKLMTEVEIWGVEERWKIVGNMVETLEASNGDPSGSS
jgi:hypothetical protein